MNQVAADDSRSVSLGLLAWILIPLAFAAAAAAAAAQTGDPRVQDMLELQSQTAREEQRVQNRIDTLANEVQEILSEYRLKLQALDRVRRYNGNLERTIADQEREKDSLVSQIADFGELEQGIVPLMLDMVDVLAEFVSLDVPFQMQERQNRLHRLRRIMDRADVSVAEKYRHVMEAYQVETAFGRTIEAYSGQLTIDGVPRQVEFFRLGRILLAYQTPDREITGYWDTEARGWRQLPDAYRATVNLGLRIARKQAAPAVLTVPVAVPGRAGR